MALKTTNITETGLIDKDIVAQMNLTTMSNLSETATLFIPFSWINLCITHVNIIVYIQDYTHKRAHTSPYLYIFLPYAEYEAKTMM